MERDRAGDGYLETSAGDRYPVRYFVRMHRENPQHLYDSYGRLRADEDSLFGDLIVGLNSSDFILILEDGSALPIQLLSTSGSFRVLGVPEAALK